MTWTEVDLLADLIYTTGLRGRCSVIGSSLFGRVSKTIVFTNEVLFANTWIDGDTLVVEHEHVPSVPPRPHPHRLSLGDPLLTRRLRDILTCHM